MPARYAAQRMDHVFGMDHVLATVGLDATEQAVYESLMDGPATVAELDQANHVGGAQLRAVLDRLEESGLVGRLAGDPVRYAAAAPEVALEALLLRQEERLQRARLHAGRLAARHRRSLADQDPVSLVEIVTGRLAVLQRFEQVQRAARREIRAIDKPPYATPSGHRNPVEPGL